jgi:diacylglycerol kinase family enzyme
VTDRRQPAITVRAPEGLCPDLLFLCIVSNSAPWTYLGRRPVNTSPHASFDTGLDLLGFASLGTLATLRALRQMLASQPRPPHGHSLIAAHDLVMLELVASRPLAFQIDGEYMGEAENVCFRSMPRALRVVGLPISPPLPKRPAALNRF